MKRLIDFLIVFLVLIELLAALLLVACNPPCRQNSDCPLTSVDGQSFHEWCLIWTDGGPVPAVGRAEGVCSELPGGGGCRVDLECGSSKCIQGRCEP